MINYTYIVESKAFAESTVREESVVPITKDQYKEIYENIILKYHYPVCLNIKTGLTDSEKQQIKRNEYEFIKTKMEANFADFNIYQLPRVIYDLFVVHCFNINMKKLDFRELNLEYGNYQIYCQIIDKKHKTNTVLNSVFELNNYIIQNLRQRSITYNGRANHIEFKQMLDYLSSKPTIDQTLLTDRTKCIVNMNEIFRLINNFYDNRFNSTLLYKILLEETMPSNQKTNKFYIYRGSYDNNEMAIEEGTENKGYSLSYNNSVLNGILLDETACTYNYMNNDDERLSQKFKNKYVLKKFFYGDNSIEDNLFFIPPLHPFLQMASTGELWHVRNKIFNGSLGENIQNFNGLFDTTVDNDD